MKKYLTIFTASLLFVSCESTSSSDPSNVAMVEKLYTININKASSGEWPYVTTDKGTFVFVGGPGIQQTEASNFVFGLSLEKEYCVIHTSYGAVIDMVGAEKCVERKTVNEK